jgi:transposase-like protein
MNELNAVTLSGMTDDEVREAFERIRWPNGTVCPHCGVVGEATKLQSKPESKTRPGVWKCRACRKQFRVEVGTIFHSSHISLRQWLIAIHAMCASKKSVSALQLQRELGLKSYQSAWHLAHRIREAMRQEPLLGMLSGVVEADETYVGGKPRRHAGKPKGQRATGVQRGRSLERKVCVQVLVQRDGPARARAVERVDGKTLKPYIVEHVEKSAAIHSDEWGGYTGLAKHFEGGHHVVRHGQGEYARGNVHSNSAESFNGLFKRSILGAWHHISRQHIGRYLDEATFRWSARKISDGERTALAIRGIEGKRLMYSDSSRR